LGARSVLRIAARTGSITRSTEHRRSGRGGVVASKPKKKIVLPEPMWKNTYPEQSDEYEKAWLGLENAAIDVVEDIGIISFGGAKITALREAIWKLRVERCKDEVRTMYRILKEGDRTPEADAFIKRLQADAKKIVQAEERKKRKDAEARENTNFGARAG
jgi:hypothetical protein